MFKSKHILLFRLLTSFLLFHLGTIVLKAQSTCQKIYGSSTGEECESSALTSDGGLIMAGITDNSLIGRSVAVVKTDSLGDTLWTKTYSGLEDLYCTGIVQTTD